MRTSVLVLVSLLCLGLPAPYAAQSAAANIDVERLADGIYAVIRKEPPGLTVDANNLFIVGDEDVVVVDANISPSSTREVIAALRKITDKPVRYVINTHGHDDHTIGDAVYREMYPGVEFIAHANTRDYLLNKAEGNRKSMVAGIPGVVSMIKDSVAKNKNLRGEDLSDEERASLMATCAGRSVTWPTRRGSRSSRRRSSSRTSSRSTAAGTRSRFAISAAAIRTAIWSSICRRRASRRRAI